ncbi:hypothetical protein DBR17_04895 [Sphingomonas sp. HMWF008]|nr:hypothetical protein DBR17_04895 [Sphingomonas sp. HMWF008]
MSVAIIAIVAGTLQAFSPPTPPLRVDLAEMEKQFDENPATGLARYGSRPLEVRATVSSIDETSVKLETIYLLTVTADFSAPPVGVVPGPIVLECSGVESVAIGGGYKPRLTGCSAQQQASTSEVVRAKKHPT